VACQAIEGALESLRNDPEFKAAILRVGGGADADLVTVRIEPQPEGADVEVEGEFIGNAPLDFRAPAGQSLKIRITKAKHLPWEKSVRISEGLRIAPELEPKPEADGDG